MPILKLSCAIHPTPAQRTRLHERLTAVVVEELGVPAAVVNVLIEQVDPANWAVGGRGLDELFAQQRAAGTEQGHA